MERPGSTSSPARRNSNSQLLEELEAISQSLYKSQTPKRGGSLSYVNEGISLPGLANPRQEVFMASKNKRRSFANAHSHSNDSAELATAGRKVRHSTSTASSFSGLNDADNMDIRGRRKRNSMSPFRWRRGEARHSEDDIASDIIIEDEFERKLEESGDKSKGFWTWKPMRALSHIGLHRFTCVFSVYVNDIEGLSSSMNGLRLTVLLRKKETKDGAVETMPSRVYEGTAEFEEILHIRCHVYGGKHHSQGFKFQSRPFTISVIAVDAEELDLGRHHLDLSMLLQDTERMQATGEECNGWNVHYDLWGKARGAKLAVSLGYEILDKDGHGSQIGNIKERFKDSHPRDRRVSKSLPNSARGTPKMVPAGFSYENMGSSPYNKPEPGREMLNFVKMDNFNLNDVEVDHSHMSQNWAQGSSVQRDGAGSSSHTSISYSTHQESNMDNEAARSSYLQSNLRDSELDSLEEGENQEEEGDFEVVEIQRPVEETPATSTATDSVENLDNKVEKEEEEEAGGGEIVKEVVQEDQLRQSKRLSELDQIFEKIHALESVILEKTSNELSADSMNQNPSNEGFEDVEAKKGSDGAIKGDENIEEEAELVEGEFLHMLEEEDAEFGEKEAILPSPNSAEKDMELALILEAAENELQKATQSLESKRRAALLEDEETEALMHEWGLNEDVFQNSPPKSDNPAGLGSGQSKLPDLGEGLGCVVRTKDGGMLASMDPGHFRTGQRLVMHVSKPVVVPTEMGDNSVEILQRMAGMGTASMAAQAMKCMPLDDITGKTVGQIAFEGMASVITKHGHSEHKVNSVAASWKPKSGGLQTLENIKEEYVSLDSIAPLAMQQIEAMALEGLKIQAEMAEEEAPYILPPVPLPKHGTLGQLLAAAADKNDEASNGVMAMAISLEEWTRIDAGLPQEEEAPKGNKTRAILAAHHAHEHKNKEHGHMGNALTIALLVQLRDPLRNYEAVGSPMIALVQAERVRVPPEPKVSRTVPVSINGEEKEDEMDQSRFKIKGVHLSGLKLQMDEKKSVWGSEKQFQTGSKWLLANGMGKDTKHPLLKSKLHNAQSKAKQQESIWSLSATSEKNKETFRNPDVVFPRRFIWRG